MHFRCLSVVNFICLIPESGLRDPVQPFGLDANLKSLRILDVRVTVSAVADKCLLRRSSLHLSKPSQTLSSDSRSSQNAERDAVEPARQRNNDHQHPGCVSRIIFIFRLLFSPSNSSFSVSQKTAYLLCRKTGFFFYSSLIKLDCYLVVCGIHCVSHNKNQGSLSKRDKHLA